jgi:hypothetical protein
MARRIAQLSVIALAAAALTACGTKACPSGQELCGGKCIDITSDVKNCGACGNVCDLPNATAACLLGSCNIDTCAMNYLDCNARASDGCEVHYTDDPQNCGGCGNVCQFNNADATCMNSGCAISMCHANYADCDTSSSDGCEVDTQTDPFNCGSCGHACSGENGTCTGGSCGP